MARGNHVDVCNIQYRFGLIIIYPEFKHQTFKNYDKITLSKKGTVIGHWMKYRDYLCRIECDAKLIRVSKKYLFFKQ